MLLYKWGTTSNVVVSTISPDDDYIMYTNMCDVQYDSCLNYLSSMPNVSDLSISANCTIELSSTLLKGLSLKRVQLCNVSVDLSVLLQAADTLEDLTLNSMTIDSIDCIQLPNLTTLTVYDCSYTKSSPLSMDDCPRLQCLHIEATYLGQLPSIEKCTDLQHLSIDSSDVSQSDFSTVDWSYCTDLTKIYIRDCGLKGCIPASLSTLTRLDTLVLSGNQLEGQLPNTMSNLTNLQYLLCLSDNRLSGSLFPLALIGSLRYVYLDSNRYTATTG